MGIEARLSTRSETKGPKSNSPLSISTTRSSLKPEEDFTPKAQKIPLELWRNLETTLVWAYRGRIDSTFTDFVSENKHLSAWLILQGGVEVISANGKVAARAGQWLFRGPGICHQVFRPKTRLLSIHFQMAWLTGQPVFPAMTDVVIGKSTCPHLERAAGALERFVSRCFNHPGLYLLKIPVELKDYMRMQELFNRWIFLYSEMLQKAGTEMNFPQDSDPRINRALQILAAWPLKTLFDEEKIAAAVRISPSHLNRLFLLEMDTTPRKIFETRRLEFAKRSLRLPHSSIKEIASELGFKYLGNFSKWFHRTEGISPREFQHADSTKLLT